MVLENICVEHSELPPSPVIPPLRQVNSQHHLTPPDPSGASTKRSRKAVTNGDQGRRAKKVSAVSLGLEKKVGRLAESGVFQNLRELCGIMCTWDDTLLLVILPQQPLPIWKPTKKKERKSSFCKTKQNFPKNTSTFQVLSTRKAQPFPQDAAGYFWRLSLEMVSAPPPPEIGPEEAKRGFRHLVGFSLFVV